MAFVQSALMATYIALVCYGAWSDARALRIPNSVSLVLLAAFIPMALVAGIRLINGAVSPIANNNPPISKNQNEIPVSISYSL